MSLSDVCPLSHSQNLSFLSPEEVIESQALSFQTTLACSYASHQNLFFQWNILSQSPSDINSESNAPLIRSKSKTKTAVSSPSSFTSLLSSQDSASQVGQMVESSPSPPSSVLTPSMPMPSGIILFCASSTCEHCQDKGIPLLQALLATASIYHNALVIFINLNTLSSMRNSNDKKHFMKIASSTFSMPAIHFIRRNKSGDNWNHMYSTYQGPYSLGALYQAYKTFISRV